MPDTSPPLQAQAHTAAKLNANGSSRPRSGKTNFGTIAALISKWNHKIFLQADIRSNGIVLAHE